MPPRPETAEGPIVEVLENLVPQSLHSAAWATCMGKGWYFGHGSVTGHGVRFWKMDLEEDAAFKAIWESSKARCEAIAGGPLRVVRQYANGHTFGQGGQMHVDDVKEGAFTLLYYPNPEWRDDWDGETVFYDENNEIALSVKPKPNRALFFDGRVPHCGKAPSRACGILRVTVAYKLQRESGAASPVKDAPAAAPVKAEAPQQSTAAVDISCEEIVRDGPKREYRLRFDAVTVANAVEKQLLAIGSGLRLPGYRPGKIPMDVLKERYGQDARRSILKQLAVDGIVRCLPGNSVASSCTLTAQAEGFPVEMIVKATSLPDLPEPDLSDAVFERLVPTNPGPREESFIRDYLRQQVLDRLDAQYQFNLFPGIVEKEFRAILAAAETQNQLPKEGAEREALEASLREIAARRLRLGLVLSELSRRLGLQAVNGADLESKAITRLLEKSSVKDVPVSAEELAERMKG